ncbi:MAG: YdcF family protein [Rhizobiaceae bacterium]
MKGRNTHGPELAEAAAPAAGRSRRLFLVLRSGFLIVLLALAVFAGGFLLFTTHVGNLDTPADPQPADAIIVLTGGSARVDTGVELLMAGKGRRLLISGVNPRARIEDLQRVTGADRQLFECCIDIDHAALDTIGNAEESARWVVEHAFASVILVTNNYHMPRSLMEMRRYVGDLDLQPYPVVAGRLDNAEWLRRPAALRVLFTEYVKLIGAFARGFVSAGTIRAHVATLSEMAAE